VHRHPLDHAPAVFDRLLVPLLKVIDDRPLVVRLGEFRVAPQGPVDVGQCPFEVPPVQRLGAIAQLAVGVAIGAAPEPDRPHRVLGHLVDDGVGVLEERGELVEPARGPAERKRQRRDLSNVRVFVGEEGGDLLVGELGLQHLGQTL
jgi:hypothetical protein